MSVNHGELGAIRKTDWGKVVYNTSDVEAGGDWATNPVNAKLFVWSDLAITMDRELSDVNPIVSEHEVIHIDAVSNESVTARIVKAVTTDKTGAPTVTPATTSTSPTSTQTSVPSAQPISTQAIVIVTIGVLGLMIAYRAWKK